jgi:surfeit locus 1 family protein
MAQHRWGRALVLVAAGLLSLGFAALGVWQLQRLAWKEALIARVEARLAAAPEPFLAQVAWPALGIDDAYRRVRLTGQWAPEHEALVQATTELGGGYWVLTPLRMAGGAWVWVNRGFVPPEMRGPQQHAAPLPTATVSGLLRLTEPGGGPLRRNQPEADRWYSRDVAALSERHHLAGPVAPVFVDEAADPAQPQRWPRPGLTVVQFRNSHLVYALTWFALAVMALAAGGYVLWDDRRRDARLAPDA